MTLISSNFPCETLTNEGIMFITAMKNRNHLDLSMERRKLNRRSTYMSNLQPRTASSASGSVKA